MAPLSTLALPLLLLFGLTALPASGSASESRTALEIASLAELESVTGGVATFHLRITNPSEAVKTITAIEKSCGCTTIGEQMPLVISPKQQRDIQILVDIKSSSGVVNKTVYVVYEPSAKTGQLRKAVGLHVEVPKTCEASPGAVMWSPTMSKDEKSIVVVTLGGFTIASVVEDDIVRENFIPNHELRNDCAIVRYTPKPGTDKPCIGRTKLLLKKDGSTFEKELMVAIVE